MPDGLAYVAGRIVPLGEARVPLLDRGHLLGDGVFETMRAAHGRILHREPHERRLRRGLEIFGIEAAEKDAWAAVDALLAASKGASAQHLIRLEVTTGVVEDFAGEPGRFAVSGFVVPMRAYPRESYEKGIALVTSALRKTIGPLSSIKTVSFAAHTTARREARSHGADDALLLNDAGRVCEATTSNVLALVDGTLHAPGPEEGAVDGVTRARLLEKLAPGLAAFQTTLSQDQVARATELILTNTVAGILPVRSFDGRPLAGPKGSFYLKARNVLGEPSRAMAQEARKAEP